MKLRALLIMATMVLGGILLSGVALAITKTCNNNCIGTNGPDSITGSNGKNEIHAMGGGDGVQGLRGEDVLFGEDGDDELSGGPGVDGVYGGIGYDSLNGQESGDYLKDIENSGSYSAAQLPPNATFDEFLGGKGNDTIRANDGEMDKIDGGPGYDKAYVDRVDKVKGVEKEVVRGGGAPPQCNDGIDNDSEGAADFPDDPGCTSATDNTESPNPQVANNNAPVANNDELTTKAWVSKDINVITNDTDVDGDNLSVSDFTQPSHGQVTKNPDGTLKYTPDENDPALLCDLPQCPDAHDSFDYTVSDGNGGTDTGTVNVTVERSV
jgi:VCBS repeat-containing protein